jgi:hypothetical protein
MKSPFPGMDPYLERYWGEVHHRLITYAGDQLQWALPSDLRVRVQQRVFVESEGVEFRAIYPDVHVVEHPRPASGVLSPESDVAVAEPLVLHLAHEPITQGYLEIIDVGSGNRVVTVIEFLSPSNKVPGEGQDLYLEKQREVLAARASLVEIDLTRAGRRVLSVRPEWIPPSHRSTYQVCVRRGWKPLDAEIYRVPLQERLPVIRIPLRESDQDVPLDLQILIDQCYRNGRYDDLNYREPLDPPLAPEDAAWADQWLRSQGRR